MQFADPPKTKLRKIEASSGMGPSIFPMAARLCGLRLRRFMELVWLVFFLTVSC